MIVKTRPYKSFSSLSFDWFWANKTHFLNEGDILILGDSRVYRGVSPQAMQSIIGEKRILNLGYSSAGMSQDYFSFIRQKMASNQKVKLIIGISPYSLTTEARKNEHLQQELLRSSASLYERKFIYPYLNHVQRKVSIVGYKV